MILWTRLAAVAAFDTDRVSLRPVVWSDRHVFYDLISQSNPLPFIFPACHTLAESDFLLVEAFMKAPLGVWAISDQNTGKFLGVIRLENISEKQLTAELGYFISRNVWGQGLMTEVVRVLTRLAFGDIGLRQLAIVAHEENVASQRVAQKSGFQLVKRFKGSDRYTKQMRSYVRYELEAGAYRDE